MAYRSVSKPKTWLFWRAPPCVAAYRRSRLATIAFINLAGLHTAQINGVMRLTSWRTQNKPNIILKQ